MARGKPLSQAERDTIADLIRAGVSRNEISQRVGRGAGTITRLAKELGLSFDRAPLVEATEAKLADYAARRAELKKLLVEDAHRLRKELWLPAVEKKTHVVSQGAGAGSVVEIVEVEHDVPTFGDKQRIMTAVGIAVDKVAVLERLDNSAEDLAAVDRWLHSLLDGG